MVQKVSLFYFAFSFPSLSKFQNEKSDCSKANTTIRVEFKFKLSLSVG
jgi:hypothetical protein